MYVVISGEKGEGKTTELLRLCATHLKEKKTDQDFNEETAYETL